MSTMSDSPEIELLHRSFEAIRSGDFAVLEGSLAEDAKWRTVYEGPTNCEGRSTIIEMMSRNITGRLRGSIEETIQVGRRVLVAFRPARASDASENRAFLLPLYGSPTWRWSAHQSRWPSTSSRRASPRLGAPMTRISRPSGPAS